VTNRSQCVTSRDPFASHFGGCSGIAGAVTG
jgi:hypothetical protein